MFCHGKLLLAPKDQSVVLFWDSYTFVVLSQMLRNYRSNYIKGRFALSEAEIETVKAQLRREREAVRD